MYKTYKIVTLLLIISINAFGQLKPIPEGSLMQFKTEKVEEEFSISYCIDFDLVKDAFNNTRLRPVFLKKAEIPAGLDTGKVYVRGSFLIVHCSNCSYDGNQFNYQVTQWILSDDKNLNLHPKDIGKTADIKVATWLDNSTVVKIGREFGLNFSEAKFKRIENKNLVSYSITSNAFELNLNYKKDSLLSEATNKGMYQTLWDVNKRYFQIIYSLNQMPRKVIDYKIEMKTTDPVLHLVNYPIRTRIVENWSANGGLYKND